MIAFKRTHTSKRSILSLHSKNMWSTNVDGTLVGYGILETLRPRDTPERALRELWHTSALSSFQSTCSQISCISGGIQWALSLWPHQRGRIDKVPWLAFINICIGTIKTIKPVFWHVQKCRGGGNTVFLLGQILEGRPFEIKLFSPNAIARDGETREG